MTDLGLQAPGVPYFLDLTIMQRGRASRNRQLPRNASRLNAVSSTVSVKKSKQILLGIPRIPPGMWLFDVSPKRKRWIFLRLR
jgi:hypothetical protein